MYIPLKNNFSSDFLYIPVYELPNQQSYYHKKYINKKNRVYLQNSVLFYYQIADNYNPLSFIFLISHYLLRYRFPYKRILYFYIQRLTERQRVDLDGLRVLAEHELDRLGVIGELERVLVAHFLSCERLVP